MRKRSDDCDASTTRSATRCARSGCRERSIHSIIDYAIRPFAKRSEGPDPVRHIRPARPLRHGVRGAANEDVQFLARLLARFRPPRVLELACGSGRVTFPLTAALPRAEIVGVDSSIEMLGKAAEARSGTQSSVRPRISFVKGDMRDWPGSGDAFDAVVIACCSVSHLLTLDDRRRTWANAFRLLRPGGVFILDVRVPDLATLAESQRIRPRAFVDLDIDATRRSLGEEARLLRCSANTYEPPLQQANRP